MGSQEAIVSNNLQWYALDRLPLYVELIVVVSCEVATFQDIPVRPELDEDDEYVRAYYPIYNQENYVPVSMAGSAVYVWEGI